MSDLSNHSPEEIQSEIAVTRRLLDRKLDELQRRLDPRERIDAVKARATDAVDAARDRASDMLGTARERAADVLETSRARLSGAGRKLHPRNLDPYVGWMAVGAVIGGTMMALNGWRRVQSRSVDGVDDLLTATDVTIVSTGDLERGTDLGDLPPAP